MRQTTLRPHPCSVTHSGPASLPQPNERGVSIFVGLRSFVVAIIGLSLVAVLIVASESQDAPKSKSANPLQASSQSEIQAGVVLSAPPGLLYQGIPAPIPEDEGMAGLRLELLRLGTTGRLMQVVAHPDDEDGGMLTLEARGRGISTLLMTLNRGEGGQNKIGSNLSDVLGVVRTEELLASDQSYGVQDRFSRVADFGFSKTAEETFVKWGGHDVALADMVRVIRTFRPDVLVARFSGTPRDGHGNHQASSILTKEAFRAAADPKRFPQQIAEGLEPWQPKKLYIGNVCSFGAQTCPDADWTLRLNTGEYSQTLGMSYVQFAVQGLRHQMSQGAANWSVPAGDRFTFYRLVDSVLPPTLGKDGHEKDFFDGVPTKLSQLYTPKESSGSHLNQTLSEVAAAVAAASDAASGHDPSHVVEPLIKAVSGLHRASTEVQSGSLSKSAKSYFLSVIADKEQQAETALNLALGVTLSADVSAATRTAQIPKESEALTTVSPGQEFTVALALHNGSKLRLVIDQIALDVPRGWSTIDEKTKAKTLEPGQELHADFHLRVPKETSYTRPYWHRDNPDTESINHVDNETYATLPFPPPALSASVKYSVGAGSARTKSDVTAAVVTPFADDAGAPTARPVAVVPAFSVMLEPGTQVISTHNGSTTTVAVGVSSNISHDTRGTLRLELPSGWHSEPTQLPFEFTKRGEKRDFDFKVIPGGLQPGRDTLRAVVESQGEKYSEGYTLITREDLGSFYYYQPARQNLSVVDVKAPHDLRIGYIMGAGDDIPTVLRQIGMDVTMIPAEKLATADLSKYETIVLGIRSYDTQKDVATNNQKLLDFVSAGGTLVVQYDTGTGDFNNGKFTPYSAELSHARVTVEEAPVQILAPDDSVFHYPNTITSQDFDGWIQERGLYFMDKWDDHFKPLLASHDPGEDEQKGGLLRAQYGKGTYIYTGYAFFRQLPAGVPGAVRLFVNLLAAGHEKP